MNGIKTAGALRAYLMDVMQRTVAGEVTPEVAGKVAKMAAQINESLYAEVKIAKLRIEAGEQKGVALGSLEIGDAKT